MPLDRVCAWKMLLFGQGTQNRARSSAVSLSFCSLGRAHPRSLQRGFKGDAVVLNAVLLPGSGPRPGPGSLIPIFGGSTHCRPTVFSHLHCRAKCAGGSLRGPIEYILLYAIGPRLEESTPPQRTSGRGRGRGLRCSGHRWRRRRGGARAASGRAQRAEHRAVPQRARGRVRHPVTHRHGDDGGGDGGRLRNGKDSNGPGATITPFGGERRLATQWRSGM
eukprot:gene7415-biopygen9080